MRVIEHYPEQIRRSLLILIIYFGVNQGHSHKCVISSISFLLKVFQLLTDCTSRSVYAAEGNRQDITQSAQRYVGLILYAYY